MKGEASHENEGRGHARVFANRMMDRYRSRSFYRAIFYFSKADVNFSKLWSGRVAGSEPWKIGNINDENYLRALGTIATSCDSSENAVHYKRTPYSSEEMVGNENVKKADNLRVQNNWCEDVKYPAKFENTSRPSPIYSGSFLVYKIDISGLSMLSGTVSA